MVIKYSTCIDQCTITNLNRVLEILSLCLFCFTLITSSSILQYLDGFSFKGNLVRSSLMMKPKEETRVNDNTVLFVMISPIKVISNLLFIHHRYHYPFSASPDRLSNNSAYHFALAAATCCYYWFLLIPLFSKHRTSNSNNMAYLKIT